MTSCKDAAAKGLIDQDVELEINGEKRIVHCWKDGWATCLNSKLRFKNCNFLTLLKYLKRVEYWQLKIKDWSILKFILRLVIIIF